MTKFCGLFPLFLLAALTSDTAAQVGPYPADGPRFYGANCFASVGGNLFVGTETGLLLSGSYGINWPPVQTALMNTNILSLAVSGNTLIAGSDHGRVFFSADTGKTWTATYLSMGESLVKSAMIDGTDVLVGTDGGYLFLSSDFGVSWAEVDRGLPRACIRALLARDSILFTGGDSGVFRSLDGGTNWHPVDSGLSALDVTSLACSDTNLFVGTWDGGAFRSTNNGTSWTRVDSSLRLRDVNALVVTPDGSGSGATIFAAGWGGVYRSTDIGSSWTYTDDLSSGLGVEFDDDLVLCFAVSGDNLIAQLYHIGGVYLSTNGGVRWKLVTPDMWSAQIGSLLVSGSNLFAGIANGGVAMSTDNGANWRGVNAGLTYAGVGALAMKDSLLFAGTDSNGVFVSTNNGELWHAASLGLPDSSMVFSLSVSGTNLFAGTRKGIFLSSNNGASWVLRGLKDTAVASLGACPAAVGSGTELYAGTWWNRPSGMDGIFRSTDDGASWIGAGLRDTAVTCISPSGSNVFVGIFMNTSDPRNLLGGGVRLSTNGGMTWEVLDNGLPNHMVYALAHKGTNIFAASAGSGIFRSSDDGVDWSSATSTSWHATTRSLAVNDSNLFLGTADYGVAKIPLSELVTGVTEGNHQSPLGFTLEQNYPNPFNPTTQIRFGLPTPGNVSIIVYDILGREITTLVRGTLDAGYHTATWKASSVASGVYFARLSVTNEFGKVAFNKVTKLLLMK
jgi:photosystem II stability/assembly factor-like uncharacterized protein